MKLLELIQALDPKMTGIIVSNLLGLLGAYVGLTNRITRLEAKYEDQGKDIDGIALFVGTPRAIARNAARIAAEKEPPKAP